MTRQLEQLGTIGILAIALAAGATACGDDGASGADAATGRECATGLVTGVTIDLAPLADPPQIHAAALFDGATVWLAYNLPDGEGSGGFDVFARRLQCDGSLLGEAVRVTTTLGGNDIDPALALSQDGVVGITWQADNGTGIDNMDVLFRTYDQDGPARMASDVILETTRDGAPVTGNVMQPQLAGLADGEFAITAVRGLVEASTFQAFVQRIDGDGGLVGTAIDGYFEAGVTQSAPTVAADGQGDLYLAWVRTPSGEDDRVVHASIAAGTDQVEPGFPRDVLTNQTGYGPSYAAGSDDRIYLAYASSAADRDIVLTDGSQFDGAPAFVYFGDASRVDHSPTVAATDGGGAVAYFRNVSGIRNQVVVQPFGFDGTSFTLGVEQVLDTDTAIGAYPPALTHVEGDVYFVAWSEGASPDLYLKGRFVQF